MQTADEVRGARCHKGFRSTACNRDFIFIRTYEPTQSFTLAQLERAIQYWRSHHDQARLYHNSSDGVRQVQLLTALHGRMLEQRLVAIDLDQVSSAEFAALGCLFGVPPAHPGA